MTDELSPITTIHNHRPKISVPQLQEYCLLSTKRINKSHVTINQQAGLKINTYGFPLIIQFLKSDLD